MRILCRLTCVVALTSAGCGDGGTVGDADAETGADSGETGATLTDTLTGDGDGTTGDGDGSSGDGDGTTGDGDGACDPSAADAVETALATGDPRCVDLQPLLEAVAVDLDDHRAWSCALTQGMFEAGAVDYTPGNRTQFVPSTRASSTAILTGVADNTLAIAGTHSGARFSAFGSVPPTTFAGGASLAFEEPFTRLLEWLVSGAADGAARSQPHAVGVGWLHPGDSTDVTDWLAANVPAWTVTDCEAAADVGACLDGSDLVITGWDEGGQDPDTIRDQIAAAMDGGDTSVLYLHSWYEAVGPLSDRLSTLLGFELPYGGNYWADDFADYTGVSPTPSAGQVPCWDPEIDGGITTALGHLDAGDYAFDWTLCADDRHCEAVPGLLAEFYAGARAVRRFARGFEARAVDPFVEDPDGARIEKLLILIGDKFREAIAFPMVVDSTDDTTFLRAYYADHAALVTREINPAQPDLGDFSPVVPDTHPTVSSTFAVDTRAVWFRTSAEVSALPGRTFTATRTDSTAAIVHLRVNDLRDGSSHVFGDAYDRPGLLRGQTIPLAPGATVRVTSPYGGLIYADLEGTATPESVTVDLDGVAEHAIYTGPGTETAFADALANTQLGWAELKTPAVEVHSTVTLMQESVAADPWAGDIAQMMDLTWRWVYQDTWGLAGYTGEDLAQPASVLAFCTAQGWDCTDLSVHGMRGVQHINADRALCGYGCSGNPYDQYWAFGPLGWGESHEIGHNLQIGRLRVYGGASGEVSNNVFPVHKYWAYNATAPVTPLGRTLDFPAVYAMLQNAANTADPTATMAQDLWVAGGVFERLVFYWQLVMNNADVPELGDGGWDLIRLLYLEDRIFDEALADEATWLAQRDALGFSQVAFVDAEALPNQHDFFVVAVSFITQRDQRPYFDAWGIDYSTLANDQIALLALPSAPLQYWVVPDEGAFSDPLPAALPIDGVTPWP